MALPQDAVAPNNHPSTPATRQRPRTVPAAYLGGGQAGQILAEHQAEVRGLSRIANTAEYRLYGENGRDPKPGADSVRSSGASLASLSWAPGDGDWRIGVTYFNGYIESGFYRIDRIQISSGSQVGDSPSNPDNNWYLDVLAGGIVRINALYYGRADGAAQADTWAIWYTTDGSEPDPAGAADATEAMVFLDPDSELARLAYSLPAQTDGTTVKVIVRTYCTANTSYSANTEVKTATADNAGPSAPADIEAWRGPLPEGL